MDLYTNLTGLAIAVLLLGAVAAVVSVGVLTALVVTNRRERLAQHESTAQLLPRADALT